VPRVLLIDDTPEIAELLTYSLRDSGFEVVATGFDPAVGDLVAEHQPDALVFDCSVYQMSETLFDAVRADPARARLPIVIVSDTPEKADASLRRREAEHVLLIPKPFSGSQIARALVELLRANQTAESPSTNS
jgi:DNA-binding response OmpR family regulator